MANPLIAVVNNDTDFLTLMDELLCDEGCQPIVHREGSTAYQMIRSKKRDLVIIDIRLQNPEAGWKILELIRLQPETTHIPVIVCSSDAQMRHEKEDWLQKHRIEPLEKPFDLDDLLELVRHMVGPTVYEEPDTGV